MNTKINRRDFLGTAAAGLTFALAVAAAALISSARAGPREPRYAPNVWLTIGADGTITIVSPAAEMGQGTLTSLPVIMAEELDADWAKVKLVQPPAWDREEIRQPRVQRRDVDHVELCGARLFQADADRRRAGAARADRCRGGEMGRAGRRADHRAERRRAQGVRPAPELWRDRRVRHGARRTAEDRRQATSSRPRASA